MLKVCLSVLTNQKQAFLFSIFSVFRERYTIFAYFEYNSSTEYVSYEPASSMLDCVSENLHWKFIGIIMKEPLMTSYLSFSIYACWLINPLRKTPVRRKRCYYKPTSIESQASHWDERYLWVMENRSISFDRAHRVARGRRLERVEQASGRIGC
jgi:hypothetical protein